MLVTFKKNSKLNANSNSFFLAVCLEVISDNETPKVIGTYLNLLNNKPDENIHFSEYIFRYSNWSYLIESLTETPERSEGGF